MSNSRLALTAFGLGFFALLLQVTFLRESLVVCFGNELCVGLVLGVWFAGVLGGAAAGAALSQRAAVRMNGARRAAAQVAALVAALLVLAPLALLALRSARSLLGVPPGEYLSLAQVAGVAALCVAPCSLLVGLLFPAACRLRPAAIASPPLASFVGAASSVAASARSIAIVYVAEGLGSLAAGLLHSLVLAPRLATFVYITGLGGGVALLLALALGGRLGGVRLLASLGAVYLAATLAGPAAAIERLSVEWRWRSLGTGLPLRASRDSRYQNIAIAGEPSALSLYQNGQLASSFPDPYTHGRMAHLALCEHPGPGDLLVIGFAAGGALREMLLHPLRRLDYVELDPEVLRLVEPLLPAADRQALRDPRLHVEHRDGRAFLGQARAHGSRYDLVVVWAPDPTTALANRSYTVDFFRQVRDVLAPGGVLVSRISASSTYLGPEMLDLAASVYHSMAAVFRVVHATPGEESVLLASDSAAAITLDAEVLRRRYLARAIRSDAFVPEQFGLLLPARDSRFTDQALRRAVARENTDTWPVSYFFGLVLWERYAGGGFATVLRAAGGLGRGSAAALLFAALLLGALLLVLLALLAMPKLLVAATRAPQRLCRRRRSPPGAAPEPGLEPPAEPRSRLGPRLRHLAALSAIASTGVAGIAQSLVLLFAFQSLLGYLYQGMALLVALFMLGLAGGGALAGAALGRQRDGRGWRLLLAADAGNLVLCALLPAVLALCRWLGPGPAAFAVLAVALLAAGAATGAEFPPAAAIVLGRRRDAGRAGGEVDAADHAGACLGALATGVLLVPLLGLAGTALVLVVLKLASLALLVGVRLRGFAGGV